jgi:hypothetical protein
MSDALTKLASQESSRLEKIAAAIEAVEEGYNPEEVVAFAAEQGIHPDEIAMGLNLFEEDLQKEASENDYLQKLASVIEDENALPLVKVAAAVDLFAEGALEPDQVYAIGEANGFDAADVDFIFERAYPELAKEAGAKEETAEKGASKLKEILEGIKNAYKATDIKGAFSKGADGKTQVDWKRLGIGAAKTGTAYGVPAAGVAGGIYAYKKRKESK